MENESSEQGSPQPIIHQHWVEKLANQVQERASAPFIVTAGMTTSGPFHMGTLSEFLYPASVVRFLEQNGKVDFIFSADILDAFDAVPATLSEHTAILTPHLGKPLCDVPDPLGCCPSFGEHFLGESLSLAEKFSIKPSVRRASDDYRSGAYDEYARLFIRNLPQVREIVAATSLNKNFPANWFPLMPICSNCGRIATTEISEISEEGYAYSCTRKLKYVSGCGFSGTHKLSDHKYKLQWRLHWPSWMDLNKTHIEGAGMDHHTRGGSWDTCVGIFEGIFKKPPPISYKWGFVLFGGKKYSKSKGIGMGVTDLIKLMPPQVLAYALVRPDLEENRDISPTGDSLLRLLDEYQAASAYSTLLPTLTPEQITRAERKKALAWQLASSGFTWNVQFSDLLIYHVLYQNWDVVAKKIGRLEDVAALSPYVENWEKMGMVPSQYSFSFKPSKPVSDAGKIFFERLQSGMNALDIHNLAFNTAKEASRRPGEFFVELYQTILGQQSGPKLGKLVEAIGPAEVKSAVLSP